jgi:hypothetical protein
MKCQIEFNRAIFPPLLRMYIHGMPHRRQDKKTLQTVREKINKAAMQAGILGPIDEPIDLYVVFISPVSPDLDNCIAALYRALDAKALKGPSLLTDDGLISKVTMFKFYPTEKVKNENRVP